MCAALSGAPADGDTLFEIGSLSKTMTALGISVLVTSGKMSFEDPVQKWLGPDFQLGPYDYVSRTVTVKDLLAHRTGLAQGQGDTLEAFMVAGDMMNALGDVIPMQSLRDVFQYSNAGWAVAGEVLRAAANASSWCDALHSVLLKPMGLNRTYCHRNEIPDDVAAAHVAAVHKHNPCGPDGAEGLATYDFVTTGVRNAL